jgi:VanZ family protein
VAPRRVRLRSFAKYWLPALLWIALVLVASSDMMSGERTSHIIVPFIRWLVPDVSLQTLGTLMFIVRKLAHLTEYAILAALVLRAFRAGVPRLHWAHVAFTLAIAAATAVSDEFHQSFVASRTGSAVDVAIDLTGALIGVTLYWRFASRKTPPAPER